MQPICILAWVLVLLSVPFLLLDRATEGRDRKIKRLYQSGSYSQKRLAELFGTTTYQIRKVLAAA